MKRTVAGIQKKVRDFEEKALETIRKYDMLKADDSVLVSVSGGPDSVALLHFLFSVRTELDIKLHVFHLNHLIRGEVSFEDAAFVEELANQLDLPISSLSFDIPAYICSKNLSLQEGAREVRYQLLHEVGMEVGADKIALGHNADDQVETFLMRIIRGTGPFGLKSIPPVRGQIVRPLIEITRKEIEEYLDRNSIKYRLDESNLKLDYLRNRVRHQLMPLLVAQNDRFHQNVLTTIKLISDDESCLDKLAEQAFKEISRPADMITFSYAELSKFSLAVQRRVIRRAIETLKGNLREIEFRHIDIILTEMEANGTRIDLPGGIVVINEYGDLVFTFREELKTDSLLGKELSIPGTTGISSLGIEINATFQDPKKVDLNRDTDRERAFMDFGKIKLPLLVRTRRLGDRLIPLGMSQEKKLQDFFVDKKVPKRKRDKIPLIESQGRIVWIGGIVIDERVKVTDHTKKILVLEVRSR